MITIMTMMTMKNCIVHNDNNDDDEKLYCARPGDGLLFTFPGSLHTCNPVHQNFGNPEFNILVFGKSTFNLFLRYFILTPVTRCTRILEIPNLGIWKIYFLSFIKLFSKTALPISKFGKFTLVPYSPIINEWQKL